MPVLVTGATGLVGRALVRRLVQEGGQVRAYVRRDDRELRALGAHVAIGAADDVPRLEAALTRAHTIVHLIGGAWPERGVSYDVLNRETVECAVIAAVAADVRRFLFLSFPGADPASLNEFLAAKGKAEQIIISSRMEHAIFRCAPVLEGFQNTLKRLRRGRGVSVPGDGAQRFNPIALDDVVHALVAADARERPARGVWNLGGPADLSIDELVARLVPGARISHKRGSRMPVPMAEVYSHLQPTDPTKAAKDFGLSLTPVSLKI